MNDETRKEIQFTLDKIKRDAEKDLKIFKEDREQLLKLATQFAEMVNSTLTYMKLEPQIYGSFLTFTSQMFPRIEMASSTCVFPVSCSINGKRQLAHNIQDFEKLLIIFAQEIESYASDRLKSQFIK